MLTIDTSKIESATNLVALLAIDTAQDSGGCTRIVSRCPAEFRILCVYLEFESVSDQASQWAPGIRNQADASERRQAPAAFFGSDWHVCVELAV